MKYLSLCAVVLIAAAFNVNAHHSYAPFNMDHPIEVTGTVKEFRWTNPHTFLYLLVPNKQGSVDEWEIEGPAVAMLSRNGWRSTTIKTGEKIHVILAPRRDGAHGGSFSRVDRENGEILNTGRLQAE